MEDQVVVGTALFAEEEQAALEAKAAARWASVERGETTPAQAMGEMAEWQLEIGGCRLLLVPFNRQWLRYDSIHDTFEPTGYRAGQAHFGVLDGALGVKLRTPVPAPTTTAPIPLAAEGAPQAPARRFCGSCGAARRPEARFCGSCGTPFAGGSP